MARNSGQPVTAPVHHSRRRLALTGGIPRAFWFAGWLLGCRQHRTRFNAPRISYPAWDNISILDVDILGGRTWNNLRHGTGLCRRQTCLAMYSSSKRWTMTGDSVTLSKRRFRPTSDPHGAQTSNARTGSGRLRRCTAGMPAFLSFLADQHASSVTPPPTTEGARLNADISIRSGTEHIRATNNIFTCGELHFIKTCADWAIPTACRALPLSGRFHTAFMDVFWVALLHWISTVRMRAAGAPPPARARTRSSPCLHTYRHTHRHHTCTCWAITLYHLAHLQLRSRARDAGLRRSARCPTPHHPSLPQTTPAAAATSTTTRARAHSSPPLA